MLAEGFIPMFWDARGIHSFCAEIFAVSVAIFSPSTAQTHTPIFKTIGVVCAFTRKKRTFIDSGSVHNGHRLKCFTLCLADFRFWILADKYEFWIPSFREFLLLAV